jgi:uncharacterized membrane protein YbaN (DUF454 family)
MKILYLIAGLIFLAIGLLGIALPILPTTPFMLLTSYCLLKSSDKLNERFMTTKVYKNHVKPFKDNKGMTLKSKLMILIPVMLMLLILAIMVDNTAMRIVIGILVTIKIAVFYKIKTIKTEVLIDDE